MRRFRSLLIDKADVRLPGLHVMTFALHRHLPEHASIEPHRHGWSQAILYIGGRGQQTIAESEARVEPGTLVVLPPQVSHAFSRSESQVPLCVMIDFRLAGARQRGAVVCSLNRSELAHVRQQLAQLMKLQEGAGGALRWEGAVAVLQVLIALLRAAGWLERVIAPAKGKPAGALHTMLQTMEHAQPLGEVVKRSGYQRDHLNRLVKKETGLTLGQFRAQQRLAKAKQLLAAGMQVSAVATAVGLPDQGYFARWFRRQTGQVPSVWGRRKG